MRKQPDRYVAGLARRRALLAQKHAIASHAAKAAGHWHDPPRPPVPSGLAMRQERIEAWVRTSHPEWTERQVREAVSLAMNGVGVFALPKPDSASRGARVTFPMRRFSDHLLVGISSEPETRDD
jgi:hypothetical protein